MMQEKPNSSTAAYFYKHIRSITLQSAQFESYTV